MNGIWGIDMGGTKLEGIILESNDSLKEICRLRIDTEAHLGYPHMIDRLKLLVSKMEEQSGLKTDHIGMGTPGVLDPITQVMKNCNTTSINGENLKKDIEEATGIKFNLANDANCFAIAETQLGAVKEKMPDAEVVFGVIMGTGVGGGLVVKGKANYGRHGIGGEWGHITLDRNGRDCYCGRKGCAETIFSGPSLERFYHEQSGEKKKLKEIIQLANQQSDPIAVDTLNRLIEYFGLGLSYIINVIDPDVIVLGGGLGNIPNLYKEGVEEIKKHIFNKRLDTVFLAPKLGDSAGVYGAALL